MKKILLLSLALLFSAGTVDSAVTLQFKTKLQVEVIDELGNLVVGAQVNVYKTDADYRASKNIVAKGQTDEKGRILFKDLEPVIYYVEAIKGDLSNNGGGVVTGKLIEKKKNLLKTVIQ